MKKKTKSLFTAGRLKAARISAGMSQMKLAEKIGVTYQQIQKYESGSSELTVSRLKQFSEVFHLPPSYFLEEPDTVRISDSGISYGELSRDELKLITLLRGINNKDIMKKLIETVRSIHGLKSLRPQKK